MFPTSFRRAIKSAAIAVAMISLPAQAFAYTCQDLDDANAALTAASDAVNSYGAFDKQQDAYYQWQYCNAHVNTVDQMLWCDIEYENTTDQINYDVNDLLMNESMAQSNVTYIAWQLSLDNITC